jgi:hypothetical protein
MILLFKIHHFTVFWKMKAKLASGPHWNSCIPRHYGHTPKISSNLELNYSCYVQKIIWAPLFFLFSFLLSFPYSSLLFLSSSTLLVIMICSPHQCINPQNKFYFMYRCHNLFYLVTYQCQKHILPQCIDKRMSFTH